METENLLLAFGLTLFAGLATGIGSCLAFFARRTTAFIPIMSVVQNSLDTPAIKSIILQIMYLDENIE